MRQASCASALVLAVMLIASAPAALAQPNTLVGEAFFTTQVAMSGECDGTAPNQTFVVRGSGVATGPYTGTFTETVFITTTTFVDANGTTQVLRDWRATFTIDSMVPPARVTGVKVAAFHDLIRNPIITCATGFSGARFVESATWLLVAAYDATIQPAAGGIFRDSGFAQAQGETLAFSDCTFDPKTRTPRCGPLQTPPPSAFSTGTPFMSEAFFSSEGVIPFATPGHATGGGQLVGPTGGQVVFAFNAKSEPGRRLTGTCNVDDQAAGVHIRCLDVTAFGQFDGTHATILGTALVNGVRTNYRIDVNDLNEPGRLRDTFTIQTDSGYAASGPITQGNIQVHG